MDGPEVERWEGWHPGEAVRLPLSFSFLFFSPLAIDEKKHRPGQGQDCTVEHQ